MQRAHLFPAALLFLASTAFSQPPDTLWTRTYAIAGYQACYDVQVTRDGGFILAGGSELSMLLIRTAEDGDPLWIRVYSFATYAYANSVCELPDGGFIVAGWADGGRLMRTDSLGDTLWVCRLASAEYLYSVHCAQDGGFVACGVATSDQSDMVVVKTDEFGAMEWARCCGGYYYDCGFEARELADGTIMAVG